MICENICKRAKEYGISINKLEEVANVSSGSICKWGNSVSPTVRSIIKVADCRICKILQERYFVNGGKFIDKNREL